MLFYLIHKSGSAEAPIFQKEEFAMEREALLKAAMLLETSDEGTFHIEDDRGKVLVNNKNIRRLCRCKKS